MRAFYGDAIRQTVRGRAADVDRELAGLVGWYPLNGRAYVFSSVKPELKAFPLLIAREARKVLDALPLDGFCIADPDEPGSGRFLEWLGWRHSGRCKDGEVYEWRV